MKVDFYTIFHPWLVDGGFFHLLRWDTEGGILHHHIGGGKFPP